MKALSYLIFLVLLMVFSRGDIVSSDDIVNPESGKAYGDGLKLYNAGNYSQASKIFEKAYELDNRNFEAVFAQGLCLNKLKKYKEAVVKFLFVLDKNPKHQKSLMMLPVVLLMAGENEKALKAYEQGINNMPDNYFFYLGKAKLLFNMKKYNDALIFADKAFEKDHGKTEILETKMYILSESGKMKEAADVAQHILVKSINNPRALITLADYQRMFGKLDDALKNYQLASTNIETKTYAEHFIEVIKKKIEEDQIEKEYESNHQKR